MRVSAERGWSLLSASQPQPCPWPHAPGTTRWPETGEPIEPWVGESIDI